MAKEIVIWCECDLEKDDKRVPAREYEIAVDGNTRTVDLCTDCYEVHLAPVMKLLEDYGQPVTGKRASQKKPKKSAAASSTAKIVTPNSDGEYECDYPGCGQAFSRPQGLGRHKLAHRDYAEVMGA